VTKKNDSDRYVVPNPDGGWDVKKERAKRASAHEDTQKKAIKRAREIVDNLGGGEVRIHRKNPTRFNDSDTQSGPKHRESKKRDKK
jgi:Uncharacterized protein conserved in bacteria (DUF2188)